MDNQMENGSNDRNGPNDSLQDTRLTKLKFEIAQEMGIKPKAKNNKN